MLCAVIVGVAVLQGVSTLEQPAPARAADLSQFDPGNIIDDSLFWDGNAMNVDQVQAFLNSKVSRCAAGYTCLKDYHETTYTIAATPMCGQYTGAANESAATIIVRIGQLCGISQKSLLVILQKEQGLVTSTAPSAGAYRSAMGAGCPDTSACDANYYGFFNQLHYGAYQLKRYTQPPGTGPGTAYTTRFDLRYPVGSVTAVLYNPNASCGTKAVTISNQATHALYIYTPYTPNAAALAAGYGVGDGCSSYGNRNFYNYYVDWFGSVRGFPVGVYFTAYYAANSSWLGFATGPMTCGRPDSGCIQMFQGGQVSGSYSTVAAGVHNDFGQAWGWYGREGGPLGYPITEYRCDNMANGCRQEFQGGWIVSFGGAGPIVILDATRQAWSNYGRELGPLGIPLGSQICAGMGGGACRQEFQGGWIVQTGGAAIVVPTAVVTTWNGWGREFNILGLPAAAPAGDITTGNYTQAFQGGTITVTNGVGALTSATDPWVNALVTSSWLGASTAAKSCTLGGGGCYQAFQNGWIVQGPAGTFALPTAVLTTWGNYGREYNILGFPSGAPSANPTTGNYTQRFQGGTITVANGVGALTATSDPWLGTVLTSSWLGASTAAKSCTLGGGGCYQAFQNGWIVQGPAGTFAVPTAVVTMWGYYGREYNVLGFPSGAPSANPTTGNYTQAFQGGTITVTGGAATVTLR
ncbi:MAG: hypothetical protein JWN36_2067 [Microbacteriaceae bacterium]|nr:hypothetical protein [Microbacteriaceae bacterium]